jgi:cytochrome b subunit of formate dehydrogenase
MFQTIADGAFVVTIIGIVLHWVLFPAGSGSGLVQRTVHVCSLLLIEQRLSLIGALRKLCYLVAAVCFVILGITGFYPLLAQGVHISGYWMMIHATFAPIFALCLAILAVTWASRFRFEKGDCPWLQRLLRKVTSLRIPMPEGPCQCAIVTWKVTFWLIVASALPLILSIILSMLPLVGTDGQNLLLAVHRWTAILFAVVVIIHTYMAVRIRMAH